MILGIFFCYLGFFKLNNICIKIKNSPSIVIIKTNTLPKNIDIHVQ